MAFGYTDMCRLCMSENHANIYIFNENLFEIINCLLAIKVSHHADLPNYICVDCHSKLKIISKFRDVVQNADRKFKSLIAGTFADISDATKSLKRTNISTLKELPSTKEVIQGLLQIKGLTVKRITGMVTQQQTPQKKSNVGDCRSMESINNLRVILEKSGIIIKKIPLKNAQIVRLNDTLLENDNTELMDEEDDIANDELSIESETDDDFIPEETFKKSPNRPRKMLGGLTTHTKHKNYREKSITPSKHSTPSFEIKTTSTYVCMSCRKRFPSYDVLKEHIATDDICKNMKLTCEKCGKIVKDRKAMYQHSLTHKEKQTYICEECGKTYTNIFSMENHKAIMHAGTEELTGSVYKCKVCNETFIKRKDLFLHINKHTKEQVHLCDACGKCFSTEDNLRSHLRTHSDIRPYACDSCEKQFRTKLALVQHSHRHTGIKPFVCDVCGKMFAKKCSLTGHARIHSGETVVYQCHICLEQFSSNSKLKTHIKFHPA